jgi:cell wall assembly regulator SMI1
LKYLLLLIAVAALGIVMCWRSEASATQPAVDELSHPNIESSLNAWLQRFDEKKIRMRDQLNVGASEEEIAAFESKIGAPLPPDVRKSPFKVTYMTGQPNIIELPFPLKADEFVGNLFGSYEFLSLDEAHAEWNNWKVIIEQSTAEELADFDSHVDRRGNDPVKKQYVSLKWIPIAKDGGGNSYAIDLDPAVNGKVGQVIVIGPDEDLRRVIAPDIKALLDRNSAKPIADDDGDEQRYFFGLIDP